MGHAYVRQPPPEPFQRRGAKNADDWDIAMVGRFDKAMQEGADVPDLDLSFAIWQSIVLDTVGVLLTRDHFEEALNRWYRNPRKLPSMTLVMDAQGHVFQGLGIRSRSVLGRGSKEHPGVEDDKEELAA